MKEQKSSLSQESNFTVTQSNSSVVHILPAVPQKVMKKRQYKTCVSGESWRNLHFSPPSVFRVLNKDFGRWNEPCDRRKSKNLQDSARTAAGRWRKVSWSSKSLKRSSQDSRIASCRSCTIGAGDRIRRRRRRAATLRLPWGGRQEATADPSAGITRGCTARASLPLTSQVTWPGAAFNYQPGEAYMWASQYQFSHKWQD